MARVAMAAPIDARRRDRAACANGHQRHDAAARLARVPTVSRREGGEGFFNSPRDARNMGAMMVMETDHETT